MVTVDEQRTLQRENAEADPRIWEGLQDMNAAQAEGHKDIAAKSARITADAEKRAAEAAEKAAKAKDRLDKLAKGEDVSGGLVKPMTHEQMKKILKDSGWTDADIRFSMEQATLSEDEFGALVQEECAARHRHQKMPVTLGLWPTSQAHRSLGYYLAQRFPSPYFFRAVSIFCYP